MPKNKTHEEYVEEVAKINSNIEVIGTYVDSKTKILHKCKIDKHEWYACPNGILTGRGCPMCKNRGTSIRLVKTHQEYVTMVEKINPNIEVVEQYVDSQTKILHRCKIDGHTWLATPHYTMHKHGCAVCSGHIVGPPPEYKNSIWASEYKEYFSQFLTEEQMKQYTPCSNKRITIICPRCKNQKEMSVNKLFYRGLCCICGDKISFANKFVFNVLQQLDVRVKIEYSPNWAQGKKYDDYLIDYDLIIENHGIQHYERGFDILGGRTLQEEKENDAIKQKLAYQNHISHYVVLDCRKSTLQWIKTSILNSELLKILNFKEDEIDWDEAFRYATSSLVFYAAELFNQGVCITDISKQMGYSTNAIRKWLRDATQLNICHYDPDNTRQQHYNSIKKAIRCIELNKIFSSATEAGKFIQQKNGSNVSKCCYHPAWTAGGYHWEYIE